ncbi:MAG: GNAT family N-acetyltransferase [Chloroflexi bacterium]|nr:GNAT family N-acetyltransferase [Chloroflexota bacterium]
MLKIEPALKEGFTARAPEPSDIQAVFELIAACDAAEIGQSEVSLDELRGQWNAPDFDAQADAQIIFAPDGRAAGYVEVWDKLRSVTPYVDIFVPPAYEGLGLRDYLLAWGEERARQAFARVPEGARVAMRSGITNGHEAARRSLEDAGLSLVRHFLRMVIDLNEPPAPPEWPDGITVRGAVRGQDERAVLQAQRDSFQDHWGYVESPFEENLQSWLHRWQTSDGFDPSLWFLALDGDRIAGISLCRPYIPGHEAMGWVATLGVTRPYRRRGLALALLRHSFQVLYQRGSRQVGLGVDASNLTGAVALYKKAGMHIALQFDTYEKELRPGVDITRQSVE